MTHTYVINIHNTYICKLRVKPHVFGTQFHNKGCLSQTETDVNSVHLTENTTLPSSCQLPNPPVNHPTLLSIIQPSCQLHNPSVNHPTLLSIIQPSCQLHNPSVNYLNLLYTTHSFCQPHSPHLKLIPCLSFIIRLRYNIYIYIYIMNLLSDTSVVSDNAQSCCME